MKNLLALSLIASSSVALADTPTLEEIIVSAEFRDISQQSLAASVSVFDSDTITSKQANNLEDLLNLAPNVNFAQGASRGRFIQIRGIGKRSEFSSPINHSVGILVDGIDFTTIGAGVSTLDVGQVEILRGPQGTIYGANALAGLINVVSNQPTDEFEGEVGFGVGNYGRGELRAIINTPISDTLKARFAVQQFNHNGYVDNTYLGRDDTNNIEELSLKSVVSYTPSDELSINTTFVYVNADNGYDAFSLDNNRTTLSDQPGHDLQETLALSTNIQYELNENNQLDLTLSGAHSLLAYGYDEDWAYDDLCTDFTCIYGGYSSFDNYRRDNGSFTADLRWLSTLSDSLSLVGGVYVREQEIDLERIYTYDDPLYNQYDTSNLAVYGQTDWSISDATRLSLGLRFEQREADYSDNRGVNFNPDEDLWGAKLSLSQDLNDNNTAYALIARGYTTGGFNIDGSLPEQFREFETEYQWNYEIGLKGNSENMQYSVAAFYQDRTDIHTNQSFVTSIETGELGGTCPCSFTDYIDNGAAAISMGLEGEIEWQTADNVTLFASLGLLKAEFDNYQSFSHVNADSDTGTAYDLDGRSVAHAPHWQYTVGSIIKLNDAFSVQIDTEGKDSFYFSDRHQEKSDTYHLLNAQFSYEADQVVFTVWGKNLTDIDTQTRGFGSFGNDPRKGYATEPYYQYGAPRTFGATATYSF